MIFEMGSEKRERCLKIKEVQLLKAIATRSGSGEMQQLR